MLLDAYFTPNSYKEAKLILEIANMLDLEELRSISVFNGVYLIDDDDFCMKIDFKKKTIECIYHYPFDISLTKYRNFTEVYKNTEYSKETIEKNLEYGNLAAYMDEVKDLWKTIKRIEKKYQLVGI